MEEKLPKELNAHFQKATVFLRTTLSALSCNPLFSTIFTFYTLILLYFPNIFLRIVLSPVVISTSVLLFSLLRLGAVEKETQSEQDFSPRETNAKFVPPLIREPPFQELHDSLNNNCRRVFSEPSADAETERNSGFNPSPSRSSFYSVDHSFVEWDVRAPLEVIYEAYEGEEGENDDALDENRDAQMDIIEKYASLALYYPESDSDTSSEEGFLAVGDWESPENVSFLWEEEDKEELIEIELDGKKSTEVEEDNLIEIDLSPAR